MTPKKGKKEQRSKDASLLQTKTQVLKLNPRVGDGTKNSALMIIM